MNVFSEGKRTDSRSLLRNESQYQFLDRSNRPEAFRVRQKVEEWLSRCPQDHMTQLAARLSSNDDELFSSAAFELILHELIVGSGHEILEVEPEVPDTNKRPDYLVRSKCGQAFYVEAVNVTGETPSTRAAQKRRDSAIDVIYSVRSEWHMLDVYPKGMPSQPIRLKALRKSLEDWIGRLEKGRADAPPFVWQDAGFCVVINPRNRNRRQTEADETSVAMEMGEGKSGILGDGIREALKKKASKYGKLPHPLVVAVNDLTFFAGLDDLWAALFGSPCVVFRKYADGRVESLDEERRRFNGVLLDSRRPRRNGLSAVMYFEGLSAWSAGHRAGTIAHNPFARRPLPTGLFDLDEFAPCGDELVKIEGKGLGACLGLHSNWPRAVKA